MNKLSGVIVAGVAALTTCVVSAASTDELKTDRNVFVAMRDGTRLATDLATLDRELTEIDMLVGQARTESARHEQKRVQAAEKPLYLATLRQLSQEIA